MLSARIGVLDPAVCVVVLTAIAVVTTVWIGAARISGHGVATTSTATGATTPQRSGRADSGWSAAAPGLVGAPRLRRRALPSPRGPGPRAR